MQTLIAQLLPILVTPLTAGAVWILNKGVGLIATWSNPAKRVTVVLVGLILRLGLEAIGVAVPDGEVTAWGPAALEGVVAGLAAWLVYDVAKLAKRPGAASLLVLLLAGSQVACERAAAGGVMRVALEETGVQQADSVRLRITIITAAEPKPRGRPLDHYGFQVRRIHPNVATIRSGTFPAGTTEFELNYPQPPAGTTDTAEAAVWGLTDLGTLGDTAYSRHAVVTEDAGLTAPEIRLDTVPPPDMTALELSADSVVMVRGSDTIMCAFGWFGDRVAMQSGDVDACGASYNLLFRPANFATGREQAAMDRACVTWSTTNPLALGISQHRPCGGAITLHALRVTLQEPDVTDVVRHRYVGRAEQGPVATVNEKGVVTCHRPGTSIVTARPTQPGLRHLTYQTRVTCVAPWPLLALADGT